jgi:putative flippase GtrA
MEDKYKRLMRTLKNKLTGKLITHQTTRQLKRYIVSGLISLSAEVFLLIVFTELFKLWYLFSNILTNVITFIISFTLFNCWSFRPVCTGRKKVTFFTGLYIFNFFAANLLMYILTSIMGFIYIASKMVVVCMCGAWNFVLLKIIFHE